MSANVHFMSARDDHETPDELFHKLHKEFGFQLDVCATPQNAKLPAYLHPGMDALSLDWYGPHRQRLWMNPPYGRQVGKWIAKAWEESRKGATVVCLLPARTDTAWFHDYCIRGEVRLLRGRLRFKGNDASAPFPSMVVIFGPGFTPVIRTWDP